VFDIGSLSQDPLLNSALWETLRLQMNGLSPRWVQHDATIAVNERLYNLQKDDWIFISMDGLHKNPEIYDNPREFSLKRFVQIPTTSGDEYKPRKVFTKGNVQVRNPYVWWGGGQHIVESLYPATK
jgi:cytochrome P450